MIIKKMEMLFLLCDSQEDVYRSWAKYGRILQMEITKYRKYLKYRVFLYVHFRNDNYSVKSYAGSGKRRCKVI